MRLSGQDEIYCWITLFRQSIITTIPTRIQIAPSWEFVAMSPRPTNSITPARRTMVITPQISAAIPGIGSTFGYGIIIFADAAGSRILLLVADG